MGRDSTAQGAAQRSPGLTVSNPRKPQRGEILFCDLHRFAERISARWALRPFVSANPGLRRLYRLRLGLSNLAPLGLPLAELEQKHAVSPNRETVNSLGHRTFRFFKKVDI